MNIFLLDTDLEASVQALCDQHVNKMTLETAQILSTASTLMGWSRFLGQYKSAYVNHPTVKWAAKHPDNLRWLVEYGQAISQEFFYRFNYRHSSSAVIDSCWDAYFYCLEIDSSLVFRHPEIFPIAIKKHLRRPASYAPLLPLDAAVIEYRYYYQRDKASFAKWNRGRLAPDWWALLSS